MAATLHEPDRGGTRARQCEGGGEGVKLEEQVLVTGTGTEVLARFPFEAALSRRRAAAALRHFRYTTAYDLPRAARIL